MKHLLIFSFIILLTTACGKDDFLQEANGSVSTPSISSESIVIQFLDIKGEPIRDNFVLIDNVEVVTDIFGSVTIKDEEGDGIFIINITRGDIIEQQFTIELIPEKVLYQVIIKSEVFNQNTQIDR